MKCIKKPMPIKRRRGDYYSYLSLDRTCWWVDVRRSGNATYDSMILREFHGVRKRKHSTQLTISQTHVPFMPWTSRMRLLLAHLPELLSLISSLKMRNSSFVEERNNQYIVEMSMILCAVCVRCQTGSKWFRDSQSSRLVNFKWQTWHHGRSRPMIFNPWLFQFAVIRSSSTLWTDDGAYTASYIHLPSYNGL